MRLAHLHLSNPISYAYSLRLQEAVLERHFVYNKRANHAAELPDNDTVRQNAPPATLLTFQSNPVYTVGRRHLTNNPLSDSQIEFLTTNSDSPTTNDTKDKTKLATFYPSPRGGLLTYHAPGQLTAYLIINLRSHAITPRCFVRLLEKTVMQTCARHGVPNTLTTQDPGVWIGRERDGSDEVTSDGESCGGSAGLTPTARKICAIGVHVTHGITSHGIGLNVFDAPISPSTTANLYALPPVAESSESCAPGYLSWGFSRIVACGLEGKTVTWLTREGARPETDPDTVATSLANEFCKSLSRQGKIEVTGADSIVESDILANTHATMD